MAKPKVTKLYRFIDPYQDCLDQLYSAEEYVVVRETPKGYWINSWSSKRGQRWVSKTGFKRFAYPTKAEAADSYIARKNKQLVKVEEVKKRAIDALAFFLEHRDEITHDKLVKLIAHKIEEELTI